MRFQAKLQILFVALFITIQVITIAAVNHTTKNYFKQQSQQALQVARMHFQVSLKQRHDELVDKASALLRNPRFTKAIISANRNIITRTRESLQSDIQSDRLLVINSNKQIVFDSNNTLNKGQRFFDPALLNQANSSGFSSGFLLEDKETFQVSFVPVQLTDMVIWIGLARPVTEADLRIIKNKIALPVDLSLITRLAAQPPAIKVSSSAPVQSVSAIFNRLLLSETSTQVSEASSQAATMDLLDDRIIASIDKIAELPDKTEVFVGIYFAMEDALATHQPLFTFLMLIAVIGVGIASAGCFYVAKTVTTPIRALDAGVARIAGGNYQQRVHLHERNEIGRLGQALNLMMESLQSRSKETEYRLTHDLATGLANRDFLQKNMSAWIDSGQQFSVVLVDIAHFSEINNILGHEKGDTLIVKFSNRLKSLVKSTDFIARLTGKSFVIVLLDAAIEDMEKVAQRIIIRMDKAFKIGDDNVDTEIYMGVANFPAHGNDSRTLLRKAETALDEARHNPLRYAAYDKLSDPYKPEMLSLMGELRQGLKKGEFFFEYQPKLDLATGLITGCEALVRWNHPDRGKLFPDEFIELAERSSNIGELTLWGLSEAMRQVEEWQALKIDVTIAVNLSVRDIQYRQFTQRVEELLSTSKIDPSRIHLEITETEMMAKPELSLNILENLSAMGFKLVIDDYGVGYSSMAYIKQLPVSEIKIDRSFVTDVLQNPEDNVIVHSTVDMVHSLGLKATAEGVEDKLTLEHLQKIGCDYIQGYYIAKALDKADFAELVLQRNCLASALPQNANSIHDLISNLAKY
jgi:diguanylate cyclase (GGDEF)-like protein